MKNKSKIRPATDRDKKLSTPTASASQRSARSKDTSGEPSREGQTKSRSGNRVSGSNH